MIALAHLPSPTLGHLERAVPPPHAVASAATWDAFLEQFTARTADVTVVDPCLGSERSLENRLATLVRAMASMPEIPVIAYVSVSASAIRAVQRLVAAGATDVVVRGVDDSVPVLGASIERVVARSGARRLASFVGEAVEALPPEIARALALLFDRPDLVRSVPELAVAAGVSRRSLDRWLARAGLAPARTLLACARATAAFHVLAAGGTHRRRAAAAAGYASSRALSRDLRALTGHGLSAIPRLVTPGAFVTAIAARLRRPAHCPTPRAPAGV